jgi:hypothetical protein
MAVAGSLITLTWAVAAAGVAPPRGEVPKAQIDEAVGQLVQCPDIKAEICLSAAGKLIQAGSSGARVVVGALPKMTVPGQVLGMSAITSDESEMGTTTLVKVLANRNLPAMVRTLAASSLAERKGTHATSALARATQDKDALVRTASVRALGNRLQGGDPRVVKTLVKCASDREPSVRVEAVMGLGLSGLPEVGPPLVGALGDDDLRVQQAAAEALRLVRHDPAVEPLIEKLKSEDATLRLSVSRALTKQTGKNYGQDYPLWREWYDMNQ